MQQAGFAFTRLCTLYTLDEQPVNYFGCSFL